MGWLSRLGALPMLCACVLVCLCVHVLVCLYACMHPLVCACALHFCISIFINPVLYIIYLHRIQYSKKMGFRTVAVSKGSAKKQLVHDLGADVYIDTTTQVSNK